METLGHLSVIYESVAGHGVDSLDRYGLLPAVGLPVLPYCIY